MKINIVVPQQDISNAKLIATNEYKNIIRYPYSDCDIVEINIVNNTITFCFTY